MAVMVFVGGVFGAVEISAVAFADEAGHRGARRSAAGLLRRRQHAVGARLRRRCAAMLPPRRSLLLGAAVMTATVVALPFVPSHLAARRCCWCWPASASRRR